MIKNIRYIIIAIFISILISTISTITVKHYNKHITFIYNEINGVTTLTPMKELILETQELSLLTLYQKTSTINTKKKEIYSTIKKLQKELHKYKFHDSLTFLQKLEKKFLNISTYDDKKKLHKDLAQVIEQELQLIVIIANDSNLILDPNLPTYYLMDSTVNRLMSVTYYLNQVREFYFLENPSQKKVLELTATLQNATLALEESLQYILKFNKQFYSRLSPLYKKMQINIETLIPHFQEHYRHKHISHFNEAQIIIEEIAFIYNTNNMLLTQLLQERLQDYLLQKNAIIFSTVIFFIIIYLLLYLLFKHYKIAKRNEYLAYFDQLTSLPNRYALDRDIKNSNPIGLQLIDIKKFSFVNDVYGEETGDIILKEFADTLQTITAKNNCKIYRVAADQFISMNTGSDKSICHKVAKTIFKHCNTTTVKIANNDTVVNISLKVRIAKVFIDLNIKDDKLQARIKADIALNYAKKKHKDYITYDKNLQLEQKIKEEIKIVKIVQDAILENRVIPVFQPIEKSSGTTYECLIRIKDNKTQTLLSPAYFLSTVQNTLYYPQLTKIMIKKSFDYFQDYTHSFSINFSFQDIINKSTVSYLLNMVNKYNMQNRVIIEILETESLHNITLVKHFIEKVRNYGIQIAIDDFGSGYSNFIYLAELEPDFIKIDGSIIKNIDKDIKSFIIAKHINEFAKEIGCKTIAEFVHSKEVALKVKELHIDGLQGYYIQEPRETI